MLSSLGGSVVMLYVMSSLGGSSVMVVFSSVGGVVRGGPQCGVSR